jgi:purine-binding chemotaxis protein CheW
MRELERQVLLVVEAGGLRAGIPLSHVREIMRPLPIARLASGPAFVLGLSVIRGASVPVVDLGAVLRRAAPENSFGRFVSILVEARAIALAVQTVNGILELELGAASALPPLLSRAAGEVVEELAVNDAALLLILRTARLVPNVPAEGREVQA